MAAAAALRLCRSPACIAQSQDGSELHPELQQDATKTCMDLHLKAHVLSLDQL
jgi:hypothetical protein